MGLTVITGLLLVVTGGGRTLVVVCNGREVISGSASVTLLGVKGGAVVVRTTGLSWVVTGGGGTIVVVGNSVEVIVGTASVNLVVVERVVRRASVVLTAGQPHLYTVTLLHRG